MNYSYFPFVNSSVWQKQYCNIQFLYHSNRYKIHYDLKLYIFILSLKDSLMRTRIFQKLSSVDVLN